MTAWAADVIQSLGYAGPAFLMLAENLFPPIPSEVILPFTGFLIGQGDLALAPALAVATAGSLAGALGLYVLGRWGGRGLVLRYGGLLRVKEADLDRADDWFDRHGWAVVLFGRMVPGVRSLVSIPAGLSEMPLGRFVLLSALGYCLWNSRAANAPPSSIDNSREENSEALFWPS